MINRSRKIFYLFILYAPTVYGMENSWNTYKEVHITPENIIYQAPPPPAHVVKEITKP